MEASPEPTGILPRCGDGAGTGVRFLTSRSPYSRTPAFIVARLTRCIYQPSRMHKTGEPNGTQEAEHIEDGNPGGA